MMGTFVTQEYVDSLKDDVRFSGSGTDGFEMYVRLRGQDMAEYEFFFQEDADKFLEEGAWWEPEED